MSWTLLRGTLHQRRSSIFWFCISLVLYSWMMVWFWDKMGSFYGKMLANYPKELLSLFAGNEVNFASMGGFFQIEYLGLMWMVIIASAVILFAGKAFSGEISAGTMEFLLSQPVSRVKIATTRVAAFVIFGVLLSSATFIPIQVMGPAYGVNLEAKAFWTLFGFGTLFTLAVGGFAMLLSSMFRDTGKPVAITSAVLLFFWITDMTSGVSDAAKFFDKVNFVGYWQPGRIINGLSAPVAAWWLYAIVAVVSLAGAIVIFSRRDVA